MTRRRALLVEGAGLALAVGIVLHRETDPSHDLIGANKDRPRWSVHLGRLFIKGATVQDVAHGASVSSTSSTS